MSEIVALVKQFWRPIVGGLLVLLALGFVWSWHSRGLKLDAASAKLDAALQVAQSWRDTASECSERTLVLENERAEFEAKLAAALAVEPVEVVEYRDRIVTVTETVMSDDCPTAIAQMAAIIGGVPVCEVTP